MVAKVEGAPASEEVPPCPLCGALIDPVRLDKLGISEEELEEIRGHVENKTLITMLRTGEIAARYLQPGTLGAEVQLNNAMTKLLGFAKEMVESQKDAWKKMLEDEKAYKKQISKEAEKRRDQILERYENEIKEIQEKVKEINEAHLHEAEEIRQHNSSSDEYRIVKIPEIKRTLEYCERKLTGVLSELPNFWAEGMESSLESLQSTIYKINHTIRIKKTIDEKLLKKIFDLSDTLHKEKNFSPSLKRKVTTVDSLLEKTEEEPLRVPLLSRLLNSIVTFPKWWRTRSMGVRFFINCLVLIPIGCGAAYLFSVNVFPDVPINYIHRAVMAVLAACIGASAALVR